MGDAAGDQTRSFDLLVVGEVNPDVVVADPDPRPVFGQAERIVQDIRLTIGSSSVITACGAVRLGLRVAFAGVIGDDRFGSFMLDSMRERGVDVAAVRVDDAQSTGASVILTDGRDRAILTTTGTIGALAAADVSHDLLRRARHLHIGSWFLQDALRPDAPRLLEAARDAGLTISIDPNWDPSGGWDGGLLETLPSLDLVFPNETEVCRIARSDEAESAAVALARRGDGLLVVVKRGAEGAFVATADGVVARTAAYPVNALDTTGAGDSFDAGFLAAWLGGGAPADALRAGAVAGALSTTAVGGVDGQPDAAVLRAAVAAWLP
ncbi:MAG TPA: carbohydrate kinase family protein [Methylomirabilota bacterium]|nr:carbohydrate kinase family protein [Methylomirabilota bacterium]